MIGHWFDNSVDMEDLRDFARGQGAEEANDLNQWDINFWSERLRESKYGLNEVGFSSKFLSNYHKKFKAN